MTMETWFTQVVPETTIHATDREVAMFQFSDIQHGLLPIGTDTDFGRITARSYTAYEMADGSFVAFSKVHGPYKAETPLAVFQ